MTKNVTRSKVKEVNSIPSVVNAVCTGENHKDSSIHQQQQQQPTETPRSKQTNFVDGDPNKCRPPLKQLYTIPSDSNSILFTSTHPSEYDPSLTMDTERTKQSTKLNDHSELVINDNIQTRTIDHVLPPNNAQGHSMSTSHYEIPVHDTPLQQQSIDTTVHQHMDCISPSNSNPADTRKRRRTSDSPSIQQMDTKVGILPAHKKNISEHHQSSTGMTNTNLTPTSHHYYTSPIIMSPNPIDTLPFAGFHTSQTDTASPATASNTQSRMKFTQSSFYSLPSRASNTPSSADKVIAPIKEPTMMTTPPPTRYAAIDQNPIQQHNDTMKKAKIKSVSQYDWWWSTYYQHYYRLMAQKYPPHIPPPPPPNPWTLPTISTLISQYSSYPLPPPTTTSRKPHEASPSHENPNWHYNYDYNHHHPPTLPLSSSSPAQPPPSSPQKRTIDVLEQNLSQENPSTMKDDKRC
jgi:hypothetical protein